MSMTAGKTIPTASVSRTTSKHLIEAAISACEKMGLNAAVAVVDAAGQLIAFERMDGCPFLGSTVAIDKAWTSAASGYPTHIWNTIVSDPAVGPLANHPRMMPIAGGYPLLDGGKLVGAIGLSGGNAEQDQAVAAAAISGTGFDNAG